MNSLLRFSRSLVVLTCFFLTTHGLANEASLTALKDSTEQSDHVTNYSSRHPLEHDASLSILADQAPQLSSDNEPFKPIGQGSMRWLWFTIYKAKLLSPTGFYNAGQWPISLELVYERKVTREQLIRSTIEEWRRQDIHYQEHWSDLLERIWPDVTPKDTLLLDVDEKGYSHFFFNDFYIGSVLDTRFSHAFTAIWLSKNTLKPRLRDKLIGLKP
ncbi:MAG: hypothetical protein ACI93R_000235 [Flavobacteriales bacterium]|jgi:hypothetical protein